LTLLKITIGLNMTEYNYKELQKIAKANGLPSVMVKKEELIKILSDRNLLPDKPIKEEKSKEIVKQSEMIQVPKDLAHLGIQPIKRLTPKEVDLSYLANYEKQLSIPREIEDELIREGYRVFYPLDFECEKNMRRGCEFVMDKQGNSFKIDSGQANKKGERVYHIAMKQKLELWEKEQELFRNRQKSLESGLKQGGTLDDKGKFVKPEDSQELAGIKPGYLKHTTDVKNLSMRDGKIL
jgi:hypothetical protein